jgi:hypothetical protein
MKQRVIAKPMDIRDSLLASLKEQGKTKYRFGVECSMSGICQHHTVDEILSTTGNSDRVPSVATAIAMLNAVGLELVVRPV